MNYVTKVRKVRAVRYNGQNKAEVKELIRDMPDNFVYGKENGRLLLRFGSVDVGEWVVLDGSAKILSHDQFMALYEEANGEDLWSLFLDLYAVVCGEVNQLGERKEHHHMYQEYLSAKGIHRKRAK